MTKHKETPLKKKRLRRAGQSLEQQIERIKYDRMLRYAIVIGFAAAFIVYEWWRFIFPGPSAPWLVTFLGLSAVTYSLFKLARDKEVVRRLQLGRDGELEVAEILEEFRTNGDVVFHDFQADRFNLDHILVSREGIYVIETKTLMKAKSDRVQFDSILLSINGVAIGSDAIEQASAEANWLMDLLAEALGRRYHVQAILVYPGWWVEETDRVTSSNVWVLNPKRLWKYVRDRPKVMKQEDIRLVSFVLAHLNRA